MTHASGIGGPPPSQGNMNGIPKALSPLDVLTLTETASYLNLAEDALRAEAVAGRLIGRSVGGDWRFVREDVLKWVRTPRPSSPAPPAWSPESEAACEAEIASIYAARKALGPVGDLLPEPEDQ